MYTILTKKSCTLNYIIHLLHRVWQVRAQVCLSAGVLSGAFGRREPRFRRCSAPAMQGQVAPAEEGGLLAGPSADENGWDANRKIKIRILD